jgi:hypothetical protein
MTFNLGFDGRQRPLVVFHKYDGKGRSQLYVSRPSDEAHWESRQISSWNFRWSFSGRGSIPAEVTVGAPRLSADGAIVVDYASKEAGDGRLILSGETLETRAQLASAPQALLPGLVKVRSTYPGMEVQTVLSRDGARLWILRWETLPRNRDEPRAEAPPATELRLYESSVGDFNTAARVGS